ncbi:Ubiquinone/menaquinone biosynthesis C-methylase UbiE [Cognatiyoonia koreensis]|uniref:Ubiquinone/menaquinone biosynthesis C-methylase UbiE n=2 Tax=Cognatiyoonia koreensis TaxID=364200 RepID=A0A1I0N5T3_9RHOB|nr:Ubiquinone/menaquinone biosynthesis C-methylase UbiE [Cognatiyoonia koreensis]
MSDTAFWDRAAPKYAKDPISDPAAYAATLGRMRHYLQPDHSVLELGCGTGSTALELAPGVRTYLGTDVSSGMIQIARGKLTDDMPADLNFAVGPANEIPAGDFDAILALNLLHLLPDLEAVVDKIYAALPAGGLFIAKTGLLKDGAWFLRPLIPLMQAVGKAPFVRRLSEQELRDLLGGAGFEIVEDIVQTGLAPRMFTVARKPA